MNRRVAITGVGLTTPVGQGAEQTWERVRSGVPGGKIIDRFEPSSYRAQRAGVIEEPISGDFSKRLLKRMDPFSRLAMSASAEAIRDAGLDLESAGRERIGTYIGNMYGGWGITDPSLRAMLQGGYREVSPYIASAWFPTAPQGQITIHWQLKGYSKTIAADTASSALAIGYGSRLVKEGRADAMLCGGSEAPITPYTYLFCDRSKRLSSNGYHPFTPTASGFHVGEGAAVLMLEDLESASRRGAEIYAELAGFAVGRARRVDEGPLSDDATLADVMKRALDEAHADPDEVDYVGLDAQAFPAADTAETRALSALFGGVESSPRCTTAKPSTTHLLGASSATETAICLMSMRHDQIPPVAALPEDAAGSGLRIVSGAPESAKVGLALVNSRGADGTVSSLVLRAAS